MANDTTTGRWKRAIFRALGPVRTRKILANAVRKSIAALPSFTFPINPAAVKNILIIPPSEKIQVLHQLRNIAGLADFFWQAKIEILAERTCAPLAGLIEGVTIEEYSIESKKLFSATFNGFQARFTGAYDLCCLLTRTEDLVLLNCAGRTAAPLRVGYAGAGGEPFLNLHVNPSAERVLASDWNCAMAEMLGAKKLRNSKWAIARQTALEIDHMLKEHHLDAQTGPTGIDALFFRRTFGVPWTEKCLDAVLPFVGNNVYLFAEETGDSSELSWLGKFGLPVLANLPIPQVAALTAKSKLMVTGNTFLFALACHLAPGVIGIFECSEIAANCPQQPGISSLSYIHSPGAETILELGSALREHHSSQSSPGSPGFH